MKYGGPPMQPANSKTPAIPIGANVRSAALAMAIATCGARPDAGFTQRYTATEKNPEHDGTEAVETRYAQAAPCHMRIGEREKHQNYERR
jgi:hypothetical protein